MKREELFWAKVDRKGQNDCWDWLAYRNVDGYGIFGWYHGKTERAHRVAYIFTFGPLQPGEQVLHHCDNRACVNPTHLFKGSQQDNIKDMVSKHRQKGAPGEKNAAAKINEDIVREIRQLRATQKLVYEVLAERFNISRSMVQIICAGEAWKHVQ